MMYRSSCLSLVLLWGISLAANRPQPVSLPTRVVLSTLSAQDAPSIITSERGFDVIATSGKRRKKYTVKNQHLSIAFEKGMVVINDVISARDHVFIVPVNGLFTFSGQQHVGTVGGAVYTKEFSLTHYVDDSNQAYQCSVAIGKGLQNITQRKRRGTVAAEKIDLSAHRHPYNVRVLLDEQDYYTKRTWQIHTSEGFAVVDPADSSAPVTYYGPQVTVKEKDGCISIDGKKYGQQRLYLVPLQGKASVFDGNCYLGAFLISRYRDKILLINSLDIEDYVYSVLKSESWPGWPLEINKAFAIASRSYVIAMVFRARANKLPYHIRNTSVHQNYNGHHDTPVLHQAVEQTKGVFLAHNKQPIIAMFDICCGGIIPAKVHDMDFSKAPYLARSYACTYCKGCKNYTWQASYSLDELEYLLRKDFPYLKNIRTIKVAHKDNAGLVKRVIIHGHRRTVNISGKQLRSLCKRIKSTCFTITRDGDDVIFNGRGRGHHMGICQWGAREMVRQGYSYKEVLEFYYPKTQFMKLD